MDPRLKKLKIQTGVVKRLGKEKLSYRKEADKLNEKVDKMKADGKDETEIKKMNECVQESLMMIPDCHRRLEKAIPELQTLVNDLSEEFGEASEMNDAKNVLNEAKEQLKVE